MTLRVRIDIQSPGGRGAKESLVPIRDFAPYLRSGHVMTLHSSDGRIAWMEVKYLYKDACRILSPRTSCIALEDAFWRCIYVSRRSSRSRSSKFTYASIPWSDLTRSAYDKQDVSRAA